MHAEDVNKLIFREVIYRDHSKLDKLVRVPDERFNLLDPSLGPVELLFELLRLL